MKNPGPYILFIFVALVLGFALGAHQATRPTVSQVCKKDTVIIYQTSAQAPETKPTQESLPEKFTVVKASSGKYYVKSSWTGVVKSPMASRAEAEGAAEYIRQFYRDLEEIKQLDK